MLRRLLILMVALWGTCLVAEPKADADFLISNFVDPMHWEGEHLRMRSRSDWLYSDQFRERNVIIENYWRFREMIPAAAIDEVVLLLKAQGAEHFIEGYGTEHISYIAKFFRTPAGKKILSVAKSEGLLRAEWYRKPPQNDPFGELRDHFSLLEIARYRAFTQTPAGQVFVRKTWPILKSVFSSNWPEPPLNRPHIVEILKADGVLAFSSRFTRQTLIRELSVSDP